VGGLSDAEALLQAQIAASAGAAIAARERVLLSAPAIGAY
jgi:hypothetical protein